MSIASNALVIGLTGPFGTGCSTVADELEQREGFSAIRLSRFLMEEWKRQNPDRENRRGDLQTLGDEIRRESNDPGILARKEIARLKNDTVNYGRIVFDGIRNVGEINVLRECFG